MSDDTARAAAAMNARLSPSEQRSATLRPPVEREVMQMMSNDLESLRIERDTLIFERDAARTLARAGAEGIKEHKRLQAEAQLRHTRALDRITVLEAENLERKHIADASRKHLMEMEKRVRQLLHDREEMASRLEALRQIAAGLVTLATTPKVNT